MSTSSPRRSIWRCGLVTGPAEHDAEPQPGVQPDLFRIRVNLDRQLAGGCDDEGARLSVSRLRIARLAQQDVHDSDQERGGLPGAGLRLPLDVAAGEHRGQRLRLNRGAEFESGVLDSAQDGRFEIEDSRT